MSRRSTRSPLWKVPVNDEVREELQFHLDMRMREYLDEGMSEEEARRKALDRFGDPERHTTECLGQARRRDRRLDRLDFLGGLRLDLSYSLRQARKRPTLAGVILAILTLGIASTVAMFSLLHAALLRPLPFENGDNLVSVWEQQLTRGSTKNVVGPVNFLEWREQSRALARLAAFITVTANLTGDGNPQRAKGRLVTEGYFEILGRAPLLGRTLLPEDAGTNGQAVVVISHHLWQQRFAGRGDILGRPLEIDGRDNEIVGVMPADFALDMGPDVSPYGDPADFWWALPISEQWQIPRGRWLMVIARLSPGETAQSAQGEMTTIAERLRQKYPDFDANWGINVVPLHQHVAENARLPLLLLFAAVGLVLLIVCANVASLLVGRSAARAQEVAIRSALGAGRGRLVRQMLLEGAVLSLTAAILGLALAGGILAVARHLFPPQLIRLETLSLNGPNAALLITIVVLCSLLFGLLPASYATRQPSAALRTGSHGGAPARRRLRATLILAETTLAVMLVFGAGLMLRTLGGLLDVDPGFDRDRVATFRLTLPRGTEVQQIGQFYDQLLQRLSALPGVDEIGAVTAIPMAGVGAGTSYFPTDRPPPEQGTRPVADIRVIHGDYLQAMGIRLVAGRPFDSRDEPTERVGSVIVNRTLAESQWPGRSALGRELKISWGDPERRRVIVGVVADVRHQGLDAPPRDTIYFPQQQESEGSMALLLRSTRDPDTLLEEAKAAVWELDPKLPIFDPTTLDGIVEDSVSERRFLAQTIAAFAVIALLLAAIGIYGVTSLSVVQRTRELALRMALGAAPKEIAGMVLRQAGGLGLAALAVGVGAAMLGARLLRSLLYGVQPTDPITAAGTVGVLAASVLFAALLPAWRAARTAPTLALREE